MRNSTIPQGKEPWLAVTLSSLLPGAGQLYVGEYLWGGIFLIGLSALLLAGLWSVLSAAGSVSLGFQVLIAYTVLFTLNLFDAHRRARKHNDLTFEQHRRAHKDPWLAVFLSRIIPGLGHAYQGQWGYAILFFLGVSVSTLLLGWLPFGVLISLGCLYFCFYHAYMSSPSSRVKPWRMIWGIFLIILLLDLSQQVVSRITESGWEARYIPSGSMEPSLQVGDRLLINKIKYRLGSPQRTDIVIFSPPPNLQSSGVNAPLISRIVGLPEEIVEIKAGQVFINGNALVENYMKEPPQYEYEQTKIPSGSYFVLGDNRNNAFDSHAWGFVPKSYIFGKATKIFWPLDRAGPITSS
jgi:signal peptidase I